METILKRTDSTDPDFQYLITLLDQNLNERYGDLQATYDTHNVIPYIGTVVLAYRDNQPVGCGCFKAFDGQSVEVKRMFVHPGARGNGVASLILTELEKWAAAEGYTYTVLELGNKQPEAIGLYQKLGYGPIENYGPYIDMPTSICMRKTIER